MRQRTDTRFSALNYAAFRQLATLEGLSKYERIGFPDSFREGYEEAIFQDIRGKLKRLGSPGCTVLDIGPGCSDLPRLLIEHTRLHQQRLLLIDSPEMLAHLPDPPHVVKLPGMFPTNHAETTETVDVILCYSVLQYVFVDTSIYSFLDQALLLLRSGGEMLVGDIPNASKRKRFLSSPAGRAYHREFTGSTCDPNVIWNAPEAGAIDDAVVIGLVLRARAAGADAYLLPQAPELPMANRREDLLIRKP
jgi:hypothetical protein